MIVIGNILVSTDIVEEHFLCNLEACKGACCWEGDWGAPLEPAELETLVRIYPDVKPFLTLSGVEAIEREGPYTFFPEAKGYGATLQPDGACAFMTRDQEGVAQCGIEQAWRAGATSFRKPISCHLYPVRISKNEAVGFEALNYDRWDICSAACAWGKKNSLPLYRFLREALVRKYGQEFYDELEAAAQHVSHSA